MTKEQLTVVGIGASAGGLDAIQQLFDHLPEDTGLSFVIIQHLSPDFKSLMPELLAKHTKMKIYTAEDKQILKSNCIYLNQRNKNLHVKGNKLYLLDKGPKHNLNLPIDIFFHTLGEEYKEKSIGIILSGTGSDGSRGIKTIKEAGGIIIVQEPDSAQFDGMPNSAISTNLVDFILDTKNIADTLAKIPNQRLLIESDVVDYKTNDVVFQNILEEIHKYSGIDFRQYKRNTLLRRLEKRLNITNTEMLYDYLLFLKGSDEEKETLKQDFLIGVTSFFRDVEAFEQLKTNIIPAICEAKKTDDPIRVWVPGCSTGEEVFSIAMLIDDYLKTHKKNTDFKIFATDVDSRALAKAGAGSFHVNIGNELDRYYLENYFIKTGDKIQINKRIREKIVFSNHNLLKDPPFIRMDLISCRNLLIYLESKIQKKVMLNFQFALNKFGYLFLGNSESLGESSKFYKTIDSKWKIFQNVSDTKQIPSQNNPEDRINTLSYKTPIGNVTQTQHRFKENPENVFHKYLSKKHSPASIFIDKDYNILFIKGDVSSRLSYGEGIFQNNLLKAVSPEMAAIIRNGTRRLENEKKDILIKDIVNKHSNGSYTFDLSFHLPKNEDQLRNIYLVQFSEDREIEAEQIVLKNIPIDEVSKQRLEDLENELKETKTELQNVVEELETSNEELQSSNEELMASNEELQSTNEELQSVNEELYTVNSEMQEKNKELLLLNNDISNLLNSTEIGTLFLDTDLRIRKYTPAVEKHFKLQEADIGRPISSFASTFVEETRLSIIEDSKTALQKLTRIEREIKDQHGKYFLKRISPFVTSDNKIEGVVITFIDIDKLKRAELELRKSNQLLNIANELNNIAVWEWDIPSDSVISHNKAWEELYEFNSKQVGEQWSNCMHPEDKEKAWKAVNDHLEGKTDQYVHEFRLTTCKSKAKKYISNAGKVSEYDKQGKPIRIIGASLDITERKSLLNQLESEKYFSEKITQTTPNGIYVYDLKKGVNSFINKQYTTILGFTKEEINGLKPNEFFKLFHPDDLQKVQDHMSIVASGKSDKIEYRFKHKDGHWIWCYSHDTPFDIDENGEVCSFIGVFSDITEEKNIRLQIQKSEEQFRNVFENSPVGKSLTASDGTLKVNKVFCDITGYNQDELNGMKWETITHPDDIELSRKMIDKMMHSDTAVNFRKRYIHKDGHIVWTDVRSVKSQFKSDNHTYFLTSISDITQLVEAENKLKLSEERYQLATKASDQGIWDWWTDSQEVFYSDQWKAQLGYKRNELENNFSTWEKLLHQDDKQRMLSAVQEFLTNPKDFFIQEFRMMHKDGTPRWLHNRASAVLDKQGKVIRMFGAHKDITEQKRAEEEIRKTDLMYRGFIENATDGVVLVGYDGQFKYASNSAVRMFGYSMDDLLNANPNELTHPDDLTMVLETLGKTSQGRETQTIEYRFKHKNGDYRWIESTFSTANDKEGNPSVVINFRDIQYRKEYEEQLIEAKKRAETASIHKNQFLANMSHEIRTPMNSVIGFTGLLRDKETPDEDKNRYLGIIDSNANQLLTLIDDIIDVAKIEANELKINIANCDLTKMMKELELSFNQLKEKRKAENVDIILKLPSKPKTIITKTDCQRLRQVISNLLNNALKFTEEGSIEFGFSIGESTLDFYVKDTGIGIPENKLKEVFGEFKQVKQRDTAKYGGTGLGLAICKGIVQLLGGKIRLTSKLNQGSTFSFYIPKVLVEQENHSSIDNPSFFTEGEVLKGRTLLICEDEEHVRIYFHEVLKHFDCKLLFAENGKEAIELYKKHPEIDVILMDIRMPEMNGFEAIPKILEINPKAIIIAQTAHAMPEERDRCFELGCKDYLTKPMRRTILLSKIQSVLS